MTITLWDEVNNGLYNQKEIYNTTQETKKDSLTKPKCTCKNEAPWPFGSNPFKKDSDLPHPYKKY